MGRSSRRKRERAANQSPTTPAAPCRRRSIVRISLGTVAILALAAAVTIAVKHSGLADSSPRQPVSTTLIRFESEPQNLKDLLALNPAKMAGLDLARVNLLCAEGLPGAEKLDVNQCVAELDRWAERVKFETDRHLYKFTQKPSDYEHSEGYFRMLMLITVLQQDLGVHYDPARIRDIDFTHSEDLFIHGMIPSASQSMQQTNGGTCVSMPVLYTTIARRLGYPVRLVHTKAHIFCRWDAPDHANPAWRGCFNIEATNQGMNSFPDEYYKTWPYKIGDAEIRANRHLESLTPAEELAEFMATRGHCLLDTGKTREALDAYTLAVKLCPSNALLASFRFDALRTLAPASPEIDNDQMSRRRPQPTDPVADVERINAMNRANMKRMMRASDSRDIAAATPARHPATVPAPDAEAARATVCWVCAKKVGRFHAAKSGLVFHRVFCWLLA